MAMSTIKQKHQGQFYLTSKYAKISDTHSTILNVLNSSGRKSLVHNLCRPRRYGHSQKFPA